MKCCGSDVTFRVSHTVPRVKAEATDTAFFLKKKQNTLTLCDARTALRAVRQLNSRCCVGENVDVSVGGFTSQKLVINSYMTSTRHDFHNCLKRQKIFLVASIQTIWTTKN